MKDTNDFIKKLTSGIRSDAQRELNHTARKKFRSELVRQTVHADVYDRRTEAAARENMRLYDKTVKRLGKKIDTGESACADTFQLFYKSVPRDVPTESIDPNWLVNASVRDALRSTDELRELRDAGTMGDELSSGLAVSTMADLIEASFDRLENERDAMEKLRDMIREAVALDAEIQDLQEEIEDLESQEDEEGDGDGEEGDGDGDGSPGQSKGEQIGTAKATMAQKQAQKQSLEEAIAQAEKALAADLASKQPVLERDAKNALQKALDEQVGNQELLDALAFGTEGTGMQRVPWEQRAALGEKYRSDDRLRRLAKLIGRFKSVAFAEQRIKTPEGTAKIVDVELGDNLMGVLPSELAAMCDPLLETDLLIRMANRELLQYKTEGEAKVGLGSIILLEDGSGSMSGDRELFAKAFGGGLAHIAYDQNRAFHAIHFGSAHQMREFAFPDRSAFTPQAMMEFYETFFNGGTEFTTPLSRALQILQEQHRSTGNVKGDIVMITDGECVVPDQWLSEFKAEQERLGFHVFGIRIKAHSYYGGSYGKDTLEKICDGRVVDVKDLAGPDDVRSVFEGLHKPRELR
jgi:uncharacterized protein with von Willebrand factor type A (vWA) domain